MNRDRILRWLPFGLSLLPLALSLVLSVWTWAPLFVAGAVPAWIHWRAARGRPIRSAWMEKRMAR